MKNIKSIGFLLILVSSLLFIQCTSDVITGQEGIAGIDGTDGTDGTDGVGGVAGTTSCVACHTKSHRDPIEAAFKLSGHSMNSGSTRAGMCAQCHSSEGYIASVEGTFNPLSPEFADATKLSSKTCTTCHDMHSTFDFINDGQDFALRQIDPVVQKINPSNTLSIGVRSTSNTCIQCHQTRHDSAGFYKVPVTGSDEKDKDGNLVMDVAAGTFKFWYATGSTLSITYRNSNVGVHDGPQGDLFIGTTGIQIAGSATTLPAAKTSGHFMGASCVSCHMGETVDGTQGSHTFKVTEKACVTCHTGTVPTIVPGYAEGFEALRLALSAKTAYFTTSATNGSIGVNLAKPTTINTTNTLIVPLKYAQAYWNYRLLRSELSNGVHNPLYAKALIQNSIEALQ